MSTWRDEMRVRTWHFYWRHRGQFLTRNGSLGENPAGSQCVNPPNDLYEALGMDAVIGNAVDWIGFHDLRRSYHRTISCNPFMAGDVAVFRPDVVGPNGHVAIILDGSKTMLETCDQNWPLGAPLNAQFHSRAVVDGVIRVRDGGT